MRLHSAMREVSIREATVDDAVAITRVGEETWRVAYRGQVPDTYLDSMDDAARAERWREWLTEGGRRFYEKGGWSDDGTAQPIDIGGEKLTEVRYRIDL